MSNTYRDTNIHFSKEDGGIWIVEDSQSRLLLLRDCVSFSAPYGASGKCVGTRDITKRTVTLFCTPPIQVIFTRGFLSYNRKRRTAIQRFHAFQNNILGLGYTTYDLS